VYEAGPGLDQNLIGCVAAVRGEPLDENYLTALGASVLEIERRFNKAAGFTNKDDRLPRFFYEESNAPGAPVFDVAEEEIDSVHKI
jgi:aldehyde:ferredoxin oxidoreductase